MAPYKANAWKDHLKARITKETVWFDHDTICDTTMDLPHTLPSLDFFIKNMKKLKIQRNHNIICYDHQGMFSVARTAWMLKYFGA